MFLFNTPFSLAGNNAKLSLFLPHISLFWSLHQQPPPISLSHTLFPFPLFAQFPFLTSHPTTAATLWLADFQEGWNHVTCCGIFPACLEQTAQLQQRLVRLCVTVCPYCQITSKSFETIRNYNRYPSGLLFQFTRNYFFFSLFFFALVNLCAWTATREQQSRRRKKNRQIDIDTSARGTRMCAEDESGSRSADGGV